MQRRGTTAKSLTPTMSGDPTRVIASGDDDELMKKQLTNGSPSDKASQGTTTLSWVVSFAFLVCCVVGAFYYLQLWQAEQERNYAERLHDALDPMTREWEEKMLALQEENGKLLKIPPKPEALVDQQLLKSQEKRISKLVATKQHLQTAIQELSKRELIEKFGRGPHRVEIQLDFDPAEPIPGTEDKIIIQLASIEEMPHTVYLFLSQVDKELFNGCSFHRNAGHVMQAGPAPNFKSPPNARLMGRFKDHMLTSVSFQEYSDKYPHLPYTLGYAGRPGGPDFYISITDNTKNHGPGGQGSYDDPSEADPCFATVIEGHKAVDRMVQTAVEPGGYRHMVHNINIRYMKILK